MDLFPEFMSNLPYRVRNIGPYRIYVLRGSRFIDADLEKAQTLTVDGVSIDAGDLERLAGLDIKALEVRSTSPEVDLTPIRPERIRATSGIEDLTRFKNLEWAYTGGAPRLPQGAPRLVWLSLAGLRDAKLPDLDLPALRFLRIVEGKVRSLAGVEASANLEFLEALLLGRLVDVEPLAGLPKLHSASFERCRAIDPAGLVGAAALQSLALTACGKMSSLRFVGGLPELRNLGFADTVVSDGDMSPLLNHVRLETVYFKDQPHYSHTLAEVKVALASRTGQNTPHQPDESRSRAGERVDRVLLNNGTWVEVEVGEGLDTKDIPPLLQALPRLVDTAYTILKSDDVHPAVERFVSHHLDELDHESIDDLLDRRDAPAGPRAQRLRQVLQVLGASIQRRDEECFVLDFGLPDAMTDYVLAVAFDGAGSLLRIDMES